MRQWNNSAFKDSQSSNESSKSSRIYKDLDLYFTRKPSTSDVNSLKDVMAVKRSVKNLVLLNNYEKPFHPEIGSGIRGMLFEPLETLTAVVLGRKVLDVIENYEPRAIVTSIDSVPDFEGNAYRIKINFTIVNIPLEEQSIEVLLERAR